MATSSFVGRYVHNIDEKGRVAVPHKFRVILGGANEDRVIILPSGDERYRYLNIHPAKAWEAKVKQIDASALAGNLDPEELEAWLNSCIHEADEVELDRQGRILIQQRHRDFAGIGKEVVYTGDLSKFRLWAKDEWERYNREMAKNRDKIHGILRL